MKKCCFVIPYFGKLPNYFKLFLKTCEKNSDFNWIIFTDDSEEYNLPNNVRIIKMTFAELKQLIQSKFDFQISLEKPYKLCDYKPAYGYIFEKYLSEYRFWGHCDLDIILGDMKKYITEELLAEYDKIFCLGHMILYKNTLENNTLFMKEFNKKVLYREVFTTDKICVFDEICGNDENVNSIFLKCAKKIYAKDLSLNFNIEYTKFIKTTLNPNNYTFENEKYKKAVYLWENGKIIRLFLENNLIKKEEFLYAHFQQRKMKIDERVLEEDCFKFVPNKFMILEEKNIDIKNFKKIKKSTICFHKIEMHVRWKINKLKKLLNKK